MTDLTYEVPVIVTVEDGRVARVRIAVEEVVPVEPEEMSAEQRHALQIAEDDHWPAWEFGF